MRTFRSPWVIAVLLLVLRAILLAVTSDGSRSLHGDEPAYDDVARSLLAGHGFLYHGEPWIWKPPLWPAVLAGIRSVFGDCLRTTVLFQGLFDAGSTLLIGLTAHRVVGARAAWITMAVVALWPPFLRESRLIQTEPLFTLLVSLTLFLFVRYVLRPTHRAALLLGVGAGLAAMIRPNGLMPLAGFLLAWWLLDRRARAHALTLVSVALGVLVVISPWTIRNAKVFHTLIPFSSGGGDVFAMGTSVAANGRWHHVIWVNERTALIRAEEDRVGRTLDVVERDRALLVIGAKRWLEAPGAQLRLWGLRLWRTLALPLEGTNEWLRFGFAGSLFAIYALALLRLRRGAGEGEDRERLVPVLLLAFCLYALMLSIVASSSRYVEPMRPVPMMLAVSAVLGLWATRVSRRN